MLAENVCQSLQFKTIERITITNGDSFFVLSGLLGWLNPTKVNQGFQMLAKSTKIHQAFPGNSR